MKTVRKNVFETNSSSCHVVTICGKNKLDEFMSRNSIVAHDFSIWEHESTEEVVPDKDFIPVEDAYNKLVLYLESYNEEGPSYGNDAKMIWQAGKLTFEDFKACIEDDNHELEAEGADSLDIWGLQVVLEDVFGGKRIYWNDGNTESNPFLAGDAQPENFEGIEGPIATISAEVMC